MMRFVRVAAGVGAVGLTVALSAAGSSAASSGAAPARADIAIASKGHAGSTAPRHVVLRDLPSRGASHAWNHAPLLRSGAYSGSQLPRRAATGQKPGASSGPVPLVARTIVRQFDGIAQAAANCNCQPPDVNAAVGPSHIVESVNLDLAVYSKTGTLLTSTGLNTFLGTTDALSDPRVVYDPTWNRYAMSLTDITAVNGIASLWLAFSASSDPTGGWFIYKPGFTGGPFPAGELMDYPVLGMDADAFAVSTNNFAQPTAGNYTYNGSTVFSVAKARVYNGFGWSARTFGVPFGTAPAIVSDRPTQDTGRLYLLDADDAANVMHVYFMTNTSRSDTTALALKGDVAYSFAAPPRRVNQPGTTATLDPLDGRLVWAPSQLDSRLWFAHGVAIGSFPGVDFGYINVAAMTNTVQTAFHSSTSDDFNPSIAVERNGASVLAFVNWAYTDTAASIATRDAFDAQSGYTLTHKMGLNFSPVGSSTGQDRFGDYSSVSPDYFANGLCAGSNSAVVAQQYFAANGTWKTRIASVGFC